MVQFDRPPLVRRQAGQGLGQAGQLLVPLGRLRGRGLVRFQTRRQAGRRLVKGRFQGALQPHVPAAGAELPCGVRQGTRENLPQPRRQFGLAAAAELAPPGVGLQQRLLHEVGGVELAP